MAKIKVSEATDVQLNWLVATIRGFNDYVPKRDNFATCWNKAGPIIERERMDLKWVAINNCRAAIEWLDEEQFEAFGPTPLVAAMRCYVASKLGELVDVPDGLI